MSQDKDQWRDLIGTGELLAEFAASKGLPSDERSVNLIFEVLQSVGLDPNRAVRGLMFQRDLLASLQEKGLTDRADRLRVMLSVLSETIRRVNEVMADASAAVLAMRTAAMKDVQASNEGGSAYGDRIYVDKTTGLRYSDLGALWRARLGLPRVV